MTYKDSASFRKRQKFAFTESLVRCLDDYLILVDKQQTDCGVRDEISEEYLQMDIPDKTRWT
jgi:hypothetical protein